MEKQGHMFGLNGLSGFFLAVVLLLAIVGVLGYLAITSQSANATNYYELNNPNDIQMKSGSNANHFQNAN